MDFPVHHFSSLPSTNKKAFELARQGALHGEVVRADSQTAGRGRLGREWQSPPGKGLYFSIILRPAKLPLEDFPQITMTAGLATATALERICRKPVFLKWPNDIYMGEKKCCGILTESGPLSALQTDLFVILGIGVNVLTQVSDFSESLRHKSTSLMIASGLGLDMDAVFQAIYQEVLEHIGLLESEGFSPILRRWKEKDLLYGRWLEWVTHSGKVVYGRSEGPDDTGRLKVRDKGGYLHEVISGDISLVEKPKK